MLRDAGLGLVLSVFFATASSATALDPLLQFIRAAEVHGNASAYDAPYAKFPITPPKPLTDMSISEVLKFQKSPRKTKSTAMGAYQIIHETLDTLTRKYNISHSAKFDESMQDHLAKLLIAECSHAKRKGDIAFGNCLAGIWAALPLLSGPKKGQSKYKGIADNEARTTTAQFINALNGISDIPNSNTLPASVTPKNQTRILLRSDLYDRITLGSIKSRRKGGFAPSIHSLTTDPYALE